MKKRIISLLLVIFTIFALSVISVSASSSEMILCGFRCNDDKSSAPSFITFSPSSPDKITTHGAADQSQIYCGAFFGGVYYCIDAQGSLIKVDVNTFGRTEVGKSIADMETLTPVEMSYDTHTGKMYLMCIDRTNNDANLMYTVDLTSGGIQKSNYIIGCNSVKGMTFDGAGNLYVIDSDGTLCKIDVTSGRAFTLGETELTSSYIQSMCYGRGAGVIYWAQYDGEGIGNLVEVDPQSAQVKKKAPIGLNCAVTALSFTSDALEVKIESEDGGVAYVSGNSYYNAGENAVITAEADKGYTFGGWLASGGTLGATNDLTTTITMPNGDVSVTAFFIPNKSYQNRSLYDENSKVLVSGKKLYYNTDLTVNPWLEGSDGYDKLTDLMGKKRELLNAQVISLNAHGIGEIESFKSKINISVPVSEDYTGKKVDVFIYDGEKVTKTTAKVKEGQITLKSKIDGSFAVATHRSGSVWVVIILIILLIAAGYFVYVYRKPILAQLKKDTGKVKSNFKKKPTKKNAKAAKQQKSNDVFDAIDNQSLENSRYDIK